MHNTQPPNPFNAGPGFPQQAPPAAKSNKLLWFALGGIGLFVVLPCIGCIGLVGYMGIVGPETSVYVGNQVPDRFVKTLNARGALEEGETILYFYSDAMTDISNSFSLVSDQKVAVCVEGVLTIVQFDEIAETELIRDESFFEDSVLTLDLKNGQAVSFPVSSEYGRDERFHEAILQRMPGRGDH